MSNDSSLALILGLRSSTRKSEAPTSGRWEVLEVAKRVHGVMFEFPEPVLKQSSGRAHAVFDGHHPGIRQLTLSIETCFNLEGRVRQETEMLHQLLLSSSGKLQRIDVKDETGRSYVVLLSEPIAAPGNRQTEYLCSVFLYSLGALYLVQGFLQADQISQGGAALVRVIESFTLL